ncbi:hypothetical protein [Protofrankia symbiont of Coriaria ruscifolia]|uniref:hypothetical protein n=1 Tax=Protofrankia symbiont of Coriaria ruscifolia TaxID=1306542 RepID=UPI0013EFBFEC|nr:hypothetical protein [Protofrankia symbiont of Coriaria ruscifolia]
MTETASTPTAIVTYGGRRTAAVISVASPSAAQLSQTAAVVLTAAIQAPAQPANG